MLVRGFVVVVFLWQPCVHSLTVELSHERSPCSRAPWVLKKIWLSMYLRDCGNHVAMYPSAHPSAVQLVLKSHMVLP